MGLFLLIQTLNSFRKNKCYLFGSLCFTVGKELWNSCRTRAMGTCIRFLSQPRESRVHSTGPQPFPWYSALEAQPFPGRLDSQLLPLPSFCSRPWDVGLAAFAGFSQPPLGSSCSPVWPCPIKCISRRILSSLCRRVCGVADGLGI